MGGHGSESAETLASAAGGPPARKGGEARVGVAVRRWARMQTLEGGTWQSVVPLKPSGSVPALGRGTITGMGRWHREFLESGNV